MKAFRQSSIVKNRARINLSIGQTILAATMSIVALVLVISSVVYLSVFSSRTEALVESQSREINKQIVLNYESYIKSIIETANYLQTSFHTLDVERDSRELQDLFLLNSQLKRDVVALFLFDEEGRHVLGDEISPLHVVFVPESQWFLGALEDSSIYHFLSIGANSVSRKRSDEVISVSKQVNFTRNGLSYTGVLLIELNFQVIRDLAAMTELGEGGHILIMDDDDSLIYTSEIPYSLTGQSMKMAEGLVLGGAPGEIGGHELYLNINTLGHTRWRIATLTNIDELNAVRRGIFRMMVIVFVAFMAVTSGIGALLSMRISRPVRQLQAIMRRIEEGEINIEVTVTGQKEIVMLGQSFNSMLHRIRELMDRLVGEQREKRKTELRALQNQINPHFLYNSLDSIVWLAEHDRSDDVITAVVALARFFRISISRGATYIDVRDEIAHVRNYLTIQSIRYAGKFVYEFDVSDGIMEEKVMKLILQPLVENAIHHGIEDEGGQIRISGMKKDGFLVFEVRNTGYGMTESRIREIHTHLKASADTGENSVGVGLRNVYQRLKLYYGEEADLLFTSLPDESTIVTLKIPVLNQEGR